MTGKSYIEDLVAKLQDVDQQLERARKTIEQGRASEKAAAIAQLTKLEARHKGLAERIGAAKEKHAEDWSDLHKGFQEDIDGLKDTLESWIMQYS